MAAAFAILAQAGCDDETVHTVSMQLRHAGHDVVCVARPRAVGALAPIAVILPGGAANDPERDDPGAADLAGVLRSVRERGAVIAAIGSDVHRVVRADLAIGRTVAAPGRDDEPLGHGAARASSDARVVVDRGLVTAVSPHDIDEFVLALRRAIEPPVAQDAETIVEALGELAADAFDRSARVTDEGHIECLTCRSVMTPSDMTLATLRRLEGASDPDDLVAVVGLVCPVCGARIAAVLHYGPTASAAEADVLAALDCNRDSTGAGRG